MLLSLAQGQRHGYALKEELLDRTAGRLNLGPGTLYRTIPIDAAGRTDRGVR